MKESLDFELGVHLCLSMYKRFFVQGPGWRRIREAKRVHTYPFHVQIVEIRAKIGHKTVFSGIIKEFKKPFIKLFYNIQTGLLTSLKVITRALHPALGTDATLHTRRREASRISRIFYVWTVFTHSHVTALDQLKPRKLGRYVWTDYLGLNSSMASSI